MPRDRQYTDEIGNTWTITGVPDDVTDEEFDRQAAARAPTASQVLPSLFGTPAAEALERRRRIQDVLAAEGLGDIRPEETGQGIEELWLRAMATGRPTRESRREQVGALIRSGVSEENIIFVPASPDDPNDLAVLYKPPGEEEGPWIELNTPGVVTGGDIASIASQMFSLPAAGAGVVGALPIPPQYKIPAVGAAGALGFGAESLLDPGEMSPPGDVYMQALMEGGVGAVTEAPFELPAALGQAKRGIARGALWAGERGGGRWLSLPEDVTALNQASKDLWDIYHPDGSLKEGIPPITRADVYPILSTLKRQATMTGSRAEVLHLDALELTARRLNTERDRLIKAGGKPKDVKILVERWEDSLRKTLNMPVRSNTLALADTTEVAVRDYVKGKQEVQAHADNLVNQLAVDDNVVYNLGPYQTRVDVDRRGIIADVLEEDVPAGMPELLVAQGADPARVASATRTKGVVQEPHPEMARVMDLFLRMDSALKTAREGDIVHSSYKQLIALRERAVAAQYKGTTTQQEMGARFVNMLDEILENPDNIANASEAFLRQAADAADMRKATEQVTGGLNDRELIRKLIREPLRIGQDLITPTKPDRAKQIRAIFHSMDRPGDWEDVVSGYTGKLLRNPSSIEKELMSWEEPMRRVLYTESQEGGLIEFSRKWDRFQKEPLVRLAREQQKMGQEAVEAILAGDLAQIDLVVKLAGRKNSAMNRSLQAGIFQDILDKATVYEKGRLIVKPQRVADTVLRLKKSGHLDTIMTKHQLSMLDNLGRVMSYLPHGGGPGEGILTAEVGSASFPFPPTPRRLYAASRAYGTLTKYAIFARIFMDDSATRALNAAAEKGVGTPKYIRGLAAAMGTVLAQTEADAEAIVGDVEGPPISMPIQVPPAELYRDILEPQLEIF